MEDIQTHIRDIYDVEVSDTTVSRITDRILPIVREWKHRPLESIYAMVEQGMGVALCFDMGTVFENL